MKKEKAKCPACFGNLEIVFPETDDGLRASPETCMICRQKTECLRTAMQGSSGINVREAAVDRAYSSGSMGFVERWSRKKELNRRLKQQTRREKALKKDHFNNR
jgi:transcription elongation factor Elf1